MTQPVMRPKQASATATLTANGEVEAPPQAARAPDETIDDETSPLRRESSRATGTDETVDARGDSSADSVDVMERLGAAETIDAGAERNARAMPRQNRDAATLSNDGLAAWNPDMGLLANEGEEEDHAPAGMPAALRERFEAAELLGQGAMGSVYRARDKRLGRDVAVKLLFGGSADMSLQLLREARSQARLEHENACKVYEVGVADGHRYIVMQLIHGQPLDKAKAQMALEEKVRVVRQVTSALHEAHRLGLIHRDIKPSNIMVEQGEDGAYKPYLMDFGLARDMGDHGTTRTGVIAGTPAFMSPEQALGQIRSLDRRSDVYSVGATLYDMLCDRPPFLDQSLLRLLDRVAREDPAPLRKLVPSIPLDIEAIVMKCLEKEPERRYDSARALGDDLQRYLDGEPVKARAASLGYIALKKTKRHKAKVALAGAALAAALVVVIAWAREQRLASERATISRELGEDVKEMELFLRHAYSLPIHDIEREREVIRARLHRIEERMATAGRAGEGPGHYALGRGYYALDERERALEHLRRASAAGYAPPELDYALGLVLGELYDRALEETKRIDNSEKKKARVKAIEEEYKEPALRHLGAALGARLEAPSYVKGLIALYEGRNDDALASAKEAFEKAPWLYEPKKLEGDAYFAEGSRFRHDAAFDYEKMMGFFRLAAKAYEEAAAIASSHPQIYEAECELWIQVMYGSHVRPESLESSFREAKRACESAIQSSSRAGRARLKSVLAHQAFAWQSQRIKPGGEDQEKIIEGAIKRAEEVARESPGESMAHYLEATGWRTMVRYKIDRGQSLDLAIDRAIRAYEEAIRLDPAFLWAHNELCFTYSAKGYSETWRGLDPSASFEKALGQCGRASAIEPTLMYIHNNKVVVHNRRAAHLRELGRSPEPATRAALEVIAAAKAQNPGATSPLVWEAFTHITQASYDNDAGEDGAFALAEKSVEEAAKTADGSVAAELRGSMALLRAARLFRTGRDPEPALAVARDIFRSAVEETPWDIDFALYLARTELMGIRWAVGRGEVKAEQFDAAEAPLRGMLDKERARPHIYQTLAEIFELKAAWLRSEKKDTGDAITSGIEMADKALAINPRSGAALAAKGGLYFEKARAARGAAARSEAAQKAKEALAAAVRENPILARDRKPLLEEIERLIAKEP